MLVLQEALVAILVLVEASPTGVGRRRGLRGATLRACRIGVRPSLSATYWWSLTLPRKQ